MTVHLPLASYACVFRRARPSSLVGRDERRAPLKTPVWEANLPRDSVKFCVIFKDFVWATWGSDMKIVIEFARNVFYSSEKSGNLGTNAKKKTIIKIPSTLDSISSTLDTTLDKNLHSKTSYFLKSTHQERVMEVQWFLKGTQLADAHVH